MGSATREGLLTVIVLSILPPGILWVLVKLEKEFDARMESGIQAIYLDTASEFPPTPENWETRTITPIRATSAGLWQASSNPTGRDVSSELFGSADTASSRRVS
jgi:hypothetical protein